MSAPPCKSPGYLNRLVDALNRASPDI